MYNFMDYIGSIIFWIFKIANCSDRDWGGGGGGGHGRDRPDAAAAAVRGRGRGGGGQPHDAPADDGRPRGREPAARIHEWYHDDIDVNTVKQDGEEDGDEHEVT